MVRTVEQDLRKHKREIKRIIEHTVLCDVPGCKEMLTFYRGPYSDTKCRDHQIQGIEYGGNAYADREYTYHKKDHCEECGYNPYEDSVRFNISKFENKHDMKRCQNKLLTVDHKDGNHNNNSPDNCQTLCHHCHVVKTHTNKDWQQTVDKPI